MTTENIKNVFIIVCGIVILSFSYVGFKEVINFFTVQNKLINEQILRLSENVVSQRAELNTKLLEDKIKDLSVEIKDLIKQRDQVVNDIGISVATIKQSVNLINKKSDKVYEKPGKDKDHYLFKKIYMKDAEGNSFPVSWVMFYPNRPENEQWKTGTYPIEFHERIVLAETDSADENHRLDVIGETWIENNRNKETKGNQYPIKLNSFEWTRRELKDKKWNFNPRTSIGFNAGTTLFPSINLSFFSYGKTKGDMDWKFLTTGAGGNNDEWQLHFSPASYNVGKPIPLIDNIFIGPYISIDGENETGIGIITDVPF